MLHWVIGTTESMKRVTGSSRPKQLNQSRVKDWEEYHDQHGSLPPVLCDRNGMIIDGHHRWEVVKRRNLTIYGVVCHLVWVENERRNLWVVNGEIVVLSI